VRLWREGVEAAGPAGVVDVEEPEGVLEVEGGEALVALVGGVESSHFVFDVLQVSLLRAFVVCMAMLKPEGVLTDVSEV
jgi:hypothetical protein